jgi:endonuclease-3
MGSTSRTSQFTKVYKVLKKQPYQAIAADPERPVLEQLLFATCLENASYEAAEQALAALVHNFFDWNEVRVSTVRELSEVMVGLPDPENTAGRVKRILHSVFEATYTFDLEELRKLNLGPAVERLKRIAGLSPFAIAYAVQSALGGHAIPVDSSVLEIFQVLDLINDENVKAGEVPGLERAISKSSGPEFGSLLHQLGADFTANPYSPELHEVLLQINPDARHRLPKRRSKKRKVKAAEQPPEPAQAVSSGAKSAKRAEDDGTKTAPEKKKPGGRKRKQASEPKTSEGEKAPSQEKTPSSAKREPAAGKKKSGSEKKASAEGDTQASGNKKSSTSGLAKKKPR